MAGIRLFAGTAEVALTAATAKTVVQVVAAANHPVKVKSWGVFFDGTSVSAEPVQVRVLRQTTAGTMSALTLTKINTVAGTIQSSAQHTATAEPTAGDVVDLTEVHPQQGYEIWYPLGEEIIVEGGGRLGIECTAPAGVNVRAKMRLEE